MLILPQNWHSPNFPFTLLPMEEWFQQLCHYQTYHRSDVSQICQQICQNHLQSHTELEFIALLKSVTIHNVTMLQMGFHKNMLCTKFSHSPVVLRCSNTSLQCYQSEKHLECCKWTVRFIFTSTLTTWILQEGGRLFRHELDGICFSAWVNKWQKTVVHMLILFQN